ncbi:hypothetical protein HMPREF3215_00046 [Staphylococcus simulans]|nr:hypothetical protein HMPREF3215_00046 [Staphylococcus simulans]
MFLEKLRCSNCNKEINENEVITIKINESKLKGYTMLSNWAKSQKVFCEKCSNNK